MNSMPTFDCIYFLESADIFILEIKRTDLPDSAPPADRFKWLRIDKTDLRIVPLSFQMMDSSDQVEERYFDEGFLKFNTVEGTYIEKYNAAQHPLDLKKEFMMPPSIVDAITQFFKN